MYMIIIIFALFLFMCWYGHNNYENYVNLNIYPSRLLFMRRYAKLNKNGNIISLDVNPIEPRINETKCTQMLCPKYYSDNISCYYCD